eukprot:TRINITY_DN50356_c0_g1_i1.p1 TRINITY_DN50356_c0_g1~~TRINITY_DN50356_c0_g1_i1.p1  ORF type:complete len:249 (+),score=0.29 TRINITY_DN50356_c0_g1_i1:220-966(+)
MCAYEPCNAYICIFYFFIQYLYLLKFRIQTTLESLFFDQKTLAFFNTHFFSLTKQQNEKVKNTTKCKLTLFTKYTYTYKYVCIRTVQRIHMHIYNACIHTHITIQQCIHMGMNNACIYAEQKNIVHFLQCTKFYTQKSDYFSKNLIKLLLIFLLDFFLLLQNAIEKNLEKKTQNKKHKTFKMQNIQQYFLCIYTIKIIQYNNQSRQQEFILSRRRTTGTKKVKNRIKIEREKKLYRNYNTKKKPKQKQ